MPNIRNMPLVYVRWEDSSIVAGWKNLNDWQPPTTLECVSVGFLLKDGADFKIIVPHVAFPNDEVSCSGNGMVSIPTKAITATYYLDMPHTFTNDDLVDHKSRKTETSADIGDMQTAMVGVSPKIDIDDVFKTLYGRMMNSG